MRRRGTTLHRGGRTAKRTAGRTSGGNISGGVLATAAVPSACPPPETMSLRGRGADRTTASEEDGWGWQQVMRQWGRRRGRKVRARKKGGRERQAGYRDGAVVFTGKIKDNGDSANKAVRQRAWGKDGNDGAMSPPHKRLFNDSNENHTVSKNMKFFSRPCFVRFTSPYL